MVELVFHVHCRISIVYVARLFFFFFLVMGNLCYLHIAKLVPQVCCEILLGILQFVIHVM